MIYLNKAYANHFLYLKSVYLTNNTYYNVSDMNELGILYFLRNNIKKKVYIFSRHNILKHFLFAVG